MIPKMGKDSQGSTLVYDYQFIYVLFYAFQFILVHLCSLSPSIALFICFELFIALICRSKYIYRFIYIYYVLMNICIVIIPLSRVFQ